jgi:radical SAM-linked protein
MYRLRVTFSKGEPIKYLAHLDLHRTWERTFRRAGLPVAYSKGYTPRPRFQMAAALPVGVTGEAELLDVWLTKPLSPDEALGRLRAAVPMGLGVRDAAEVRLDLPALQSQLRAAEYYAEIDTPESPEAVQVRVDSLLDAASLPRQRRHKGRWQTYDLRPRIHALSLAAHSVPGRVGLRMRLQASPQGAGRPDEVLDTLGLMVAPHRVRRTRLVFVFDKWVGDGII